MRIKVIHIIYSITTLLVIYMNYIAINAWIRSNRFVDDFAWWELLAAVISSGVDFFILIYLLTNAANFIKRYKNHTLIKF